MILQAEAILKMNDFCIKTCPLGVKKSEEFLAKNNSAYDAALDMHFFVDECKKTCPHKNKFSETKEN
jgi:hypothetical protein